jgi:serine/threonine protein kinase
MASSSGDAHDIDPVRLEALFDQALALPADRRAAFLDSECSEDHALRARIARLLDMDASGDRLLDQPVALPASLIDAAAHHSASDGYAAIGAGLRPGQRIGTYEIIRPLGAGGMGAVYEARQARPERTVALKVTNTALASAASLRRFEYEAEILARLQHPGIAQVYEAGVADVGPFRIPFFAMELIPAAATLTSYAAEHRLNVPARLQLFLQACAAVHTAHLLGVIHRDLKPGNILVAGHQAAQVKVIDFGIARLADSAEDQTRTGDMVGTPAYMSPEQARADGSPIDARADVYALCVVLFELLTSQRPYAESVGGPGWRERILSDEPRRPSAIAPALNDELDAIILKGLRKAPADRYQSVDHLATDVRRYLAGEPIEAKRGSTAYMLRKTLRRYRLPLGVLGLIVLTLGTALVVSLSLWKETKEALRLAEERKTQAERAEERQAAEARKANESFEFIRDIVTQEELADELRHNPACMRSVLAEGARRLEANSELDVDVQARISLYLSQGYQTLEDWDEARRWGKRFIELRANSLPVEDPTGFMFMLVQESYAVQLGEFAASAVVFRRRWEEAQRLFGVDALPTLFARLTYGTGLIPLAEFDEAEAVLGSFIADADAALGRLHFLSIGSHLALVELRLAQGRYDEALAIGEEGLARLEEAEPGNVNSRLTHLSSIAGVHLLAGRPEQAEPIFRDLWVRTRDALGEDAPLTLDRAFGLGGALLAMGEAAKAEEILVPVYDVRSRTLGTGHPRMAETRAQMGELFNQLGRHAEAAEHLVAAMGVLRAQLPAFSPQIVKTTIALAEAEWNLGLHDQAAGRLADCRRAITGEDDISQSLRDEIARAEAAHATQSGGTPSTRTTP